MANLYDQATQRQKWDQTIEQVQKMGYPQNPAQPPAFTSPQPRRPTSFGDAAAATSNPGVTQVASPASPAAPTTAPAPAQPSEYGRQMSALGGAVVDGASWLGKTIVSAPGYGLNKPSAAPAPAGMATPTAGAGRGAINPAPVNPAQPTTAAPAPTSPPTNTPAAPPPPPTNEVMPGVYRHGRGQYSDNAAGMGMPANFTGQPSAQNMAAAASLAASQQAPTGRSMAEAALSQPSGVQAPVVPNSSNDWAARNNLRNMEVSAKSITANGGRFDQSGRGDSPEVSAYKAALANDFALQQAQPGLAAVAMRENAGIQREGMQQEGATTRTGMQERGSMGRTMAQAALEQQKINQAAATQGIDNRGKTLVQDLQSQIATEPDSAKRQEIAQRLREMQGQSTADPYLVVPGGQAVDEMGKPYNMPSTVFNRQTQQYVQQPKQGGQSPYPDGQRLTGKDGKAYIVKNGVPVPA